MHFKSRQEKYAYNVPVLYRLRDRNITFTGQPGVDMNVHN